MHADSIYDVFIITLGVTETYHLLPLIQIGV
jgi:hypothetical protein